MRRAAVPILLNGQYDKGKPMDEVNRQLAYTIRDTTTALGRMLRKEHLSRQDLAEATRMLHYLYGQLAFAMDPDLDQPS